MVAYEYFNSPIGWLKIVCSEDALLEIAFASRKETNNPNPYTKEVISQLSEYFDGKRKEFELKIEYSGTDFQKKSWDALLKIPYGQTVSYQEQASIVGSPNAFRAVGSSNNKNKIPIVLPCHRVIAKNGQMAGYAGGIDIKIRLLEHEQKVLKNETICV